MNNLFDWSYLDGLGRAELELLCLAHGVAIQSDYTDHEVRLALFDLLADSE